MDRGLLNANEPEVAPKVDGALVMIGLEQGL
jgi:hypothetical protein